MLIYALSNTLTISQFYSFFKNQNYTLYYILEIKNSLICRLLQAWHVIIHPECVSSSPTTYRTPYLVLAVSQRNMASALWNLQSMYAAYFQMDLQWDKTNFYHCIHSASGSHVVLCFHKIKWYYITTFER